MKRVAAVDCGTNSIRLLIAEVGADGQLTDVERQMRIVRLGEGVDATGRLSTAALERTFAASRDYAEAIRAADVEAVRVVATSATRDAKNRSRFVKGMTEIFGVAPEVVPGEVEARLSFRGATAGMIEAGVLPAYLVIDIGGGSTEFVLGQVDPSRMRSVNVGCVRLKERHFHDDPPTPAQIEAAADMVDTAIAQASDGVPMEYARSTIGVAGTVTTIAALALGLEEYDPVAVHQARLPATRIREVAAMLLASTHEQRAAMKVIHPGRVDVIAAGALILDRVLIVLDEPDLIASEHDILDGIAQSILNGTVC